jgi:hypothetical protein
VTARRCVGPPRAADFGLRASVEETSRRPKHRLEVAGQVAVTDDGAGRVQDAQVHGPCMQVDAGVESVLVVIEPHHGLLGLGGT